MYRAKPGRKEILVAPLVQSERAVACPRHMNAIREVVITFETANARIAFRNGGPDGLRLLLRQICSLTEQKLRAGMFAGTLNIFAGPRVVSVGDRVSLAFPVA